MADMPRALGVLARSGGMVLPGLVQAVGPSPAVATPTVPSAEDDQALGAQGLGDWLRNMRARLVRKRLSDEAADLATLNAIGAVLGDSVGRSLSLDLVLQSVLEETVRAMSMDAGVAFRMEGGATPEPLASVGLSDEAVHRTAQLCDWATAMAAAEEGAATVRELNDYPEGELKGFLAQEGLQLTMSAPIATAEGRIGAIHVAARRRLSISSEKKALLVAVGRHIGTAVEAAQLQQAAQQDAILEERARLARDLHDSVTQSLYAVALQSEAALRHVDARDMDSVAASLHDLRATADEALQETRALIQGLRPPALAEGGLVAALRMQLHTMQHRLGLQTDLEAEDDGLPLPPQMEGELYRIALEAMNNALRHARARRIAVGVRRAPGRLILTVSDDGVGFDPQRVAAAGMGLHTMRERAERLNGRLVITSHLGEGTTVQVEVPCGS